MRRRERIPLAAAAFLAACASLSAQPAQLANARLERRSGSAGLEGGLRVAASGQSGSAWIAWPVAAAGEHHMCCYGSTEDFSSSPCSGRCFLENDNRNVSYIQSDWSDCRDRSGSSPMLVFVRIEERPPGRLHPYPSARPTARGALPLVWLADARPAESVAFLDSFVGNPSLSAKKKWKGGEPALSAIAMHDDPSADAVLERRASPSN